MKWNFIEHEETVYYHVVDSHMPFPLQSFCHRKQNANQHDQNGVRRTQQLGIINPKTSNAINSNDNPTSAATSHDSLMCFFIG